MQAADDFTGEANEQLADLLDQAADPADVLTPYVDGHTLDVDRLALRGTADDLAAWRDTRQANAEWRVLLAQWRHHWKQGVHRLTAIPVHLEPKGLDVYMWERPEDCDHEAVRLGVTYTQTRGQVNLTPVHVDLVRVAQQPTDARLLGPTEALDLIGPDGIVMAGHPLRTGTVNTKPPKQYGPNKPTWLKPQPEPPDPKHHIVGPQERARELNRNRDAGYYNPDTGVISIPKP